MSTSINMNTPIQQTLPGEAQLATSDTSSRRDLTSWWKQFKRNAKKSEEKEIPAYQGIFGIPLHTSIRYANVAISLEDADGKSFIYGYVPIVVAKCGVYLKEKATETEGIFRLAGAERRIKELQSIFNSPERFGKGLDWTSYTVHDSANVLRRYLNQLPEPIIPLEFYDMVREPLKNHQAEAVGEIPHQDTDVGGFDAEAAIITYQRLITELPPLNRQLLLYLLDLLAVFAAKSDVNLMTSSNLAAIFQPGILSHPNHDMAPKEYRLSQDVLIFLIEHQDHFLVGMQGTAADEKTIKEVQSGIPTPQKSPSKRDKSLGRSSSTASAGAESVRRFGNIRRNLSVSSRKSRKSNNTSSPSTPPSGTALTPARMSSGVHRSNTVPSQKSLSPAVPSVRYWDEKSPGPAAPVSAGLSTPTVASPLANRALTPPLPPLVEAPPKNNNTSASSLVNPPSERSPHLRPTPVHNNRPLNQDRRSKIEASLDMPALVLGRVSPVVTPSKERTFASLFKQTPAADAERKDSRKPNKLQKKRLAEALPVAQGSAVSLGNSSNPESPAFPPANVGTRGSISQSDGYPSTASYRSASNVQVNHNQDSAAEESPPFLPALETQVPEHASLDGNTPSAGMEPKTLGEMPQHDSSATLRPTHRASRSASFTSRSSVNGYSSAENAADTEMAGGEKQKRRRWRLSSSSPKKNKEKAKSRTLGTDRTADRSTSTVGSLARSRKSVTEGSSYSGNSGAAPGLSDAELSSSNAPSERKGAFGWIRGILQKDRGKSPQRAGQAEEGPASLATVINGAGTNGAQGRNKSTVSLKIEG